MINKQGRSDAVEVIICGNSESNSHVKDLRVGDVLKVIQGTVDAEFAKPPRSCIIRVAEFEIVEAWSTDLGKDGFYFQRPVFHDDIDNSCHIGRSSASNSSIPVESTSKMLKNRIPSAILQCNASLAERVTV